MKVKHIRAYVKHGEHILNGSVTSINENACTCDMTFDNGVSESGIPLDAVIINEGRVWNAIKAGAKKMGGLLGAQLKKLGTFFQFVWQDTGETMHVVSPLLSGQLAASNSLPKGMGVYLSDGIKDFAAKNGVGVADRGYSTTPEVDEADMKDILAFWTRVKEICDGKVNESAGSVKYNRNLLMEGYKKALEERGFDTNTLNETFHIDKFFSLNEGSHIYDMKGKDILNEGVSDYAKDAQATQTSGAEMPGVEGVENVYSSFAFVSIINRQLNMLHGLGPKKQGSDEGIYAKWGRLRQENPVEFSEQIAARLKPLFIWGAPGIGKTAIINQTVKQFMSENNLKSSCQAVSLGTMSADSFALPWANFKTMKTEKLITDVLPLWQPTGDVQKDVTLDAGANGVKGSEGGVIFFDEFTRPGKPDVYAPLFSILNERKLEGYYLGTKWLCVAAANRYWEMNSTTYNAWESALGNRFQQYNYVPSFEEWINWAEGYDMDIASTLKGKSDSEKFRSYFNATHNTGEGREIFFKPHTLDGKGNVVPRIKNKEILQFLKNSMEYNSETNTNSSPYWYDRAALKSKKNGSDPYGLKSLTTPRAWANFANAIEDADEEKFAESGQHLTPGEKLHLLAGFIGHSEAWEAFGKYLQVEQVFDRQRIGAAWITGAGDIADETWDGSAKATSFNITLKKVKKTLPLALPTKSGDIQLQQTQVDWYSPVFNETQVQYVPLPLDEADENGTIAKTRMITANAMLVSVLMAEHSPLASGKKKDIYSMSAKDFEGLLNYVFNYFGYMARVKKASGAPSLMDKTHEIFREKVNVYINKKFPGMEFDEADAPFKRLQYYNVAVLLDLFMKMLTTKANASNYKDDYATEMAAVEQAALEHFMKAEAAFGDVSQDEYKKMVADNEQRVQAEVQADAEAVAADEEVQAAREKLASQKGGKKK